MAPDHEKMSFLAMNKKQSLFEGRKRKLPEIDRGSSLDNQSSRIPKLGSTKNNFKDEINNIEEDILKTNKRKEKWFK